MRDGVYERLAYIQRANTEIMLRHKRKDLELMNIFHGNTLEDRTLFRDICEVDEIDRLAVGGSYFGNIMSNLDHLCDVLLNGKRYKHYHVLGVSNILQTVLLMRLASKGFAEKITSDSSTPLQEAISKGYHHQGSITESPRFYHIGDKTNIPNIHKLLPCNCPVCRTIKYTDILGIISGPIWIFLLYHNIQSINKYMNTMNGIVKDLSTPELQELLRKQFKSKRDGVEESIKSIEYIDYLVDNGLQKARREFNYYLNRLITDTPKSDGLIFSESGEAQLNPVGEIKREDVMGLITAQVSKGDQTTEDSPDYVRLQSIMETYEASSGIHGKKVKKEDKSRKGHKAMRATGVSIPGKKKKKKKVNRNKDKTNDKHKQKGFEVSV